MIKTDIQDEITLEFNRCKEDFVYFAYKYLLDVGETLPDWFGNLYTHPQLLLKGNIVDIEKTIAMYYLWICIFNVRKTCVIIGLLEKGMNVLRLMVGLNRRLPHMFSPTIIRRDGKKIQFGNGSRVFALADSYIGFDVQYAMFIDISATKARFVESFRIARPTFLHMRTQVIITEELQDNHFKNVFPDIDIPTVEVPRVDG